MRIIQSHEFNTYWKSEIRQGDDEQTEVVVKDIIAAVRKEGDAAVRRFAAKFDRSSPQQCAISPAAVAEATDALRRNDPELAAVLALAAAEAERAAGFPWLAQAAALVVQEEQGFPLFAVLEPQCPAGTVPVQLCLCRMDCPMEARSLL